MNGDAIRKRLIGEDAKDAACSILGAVLSLGSLWVTNGVEKWVVEPFAERVDTSTISGKEWHALYFRADLLSILLLIGFAGALSRLHPLIARTLSWVIGFAFLQLLSLMITR